MLGFPELQNEAPVINQLIFYEIGMVMIQLTIVLGK